MFNLITEEEFISEFLTRLDSIKGDAVWIENLDNADDPLHVLIEDACYAYLQIRILGTPVRFRLHRDARDCFTGVHGGRSYVYCPM
ncbi:MAG: hypothetical protein ACR652_02055 [Methylocystis sp.]|uniref:hypothetical protein n=1 Tax=Methylocystis sp. TaxID=1911079 RepID=UPI003DA2852B